MLDCLFILASAFRILYSVFFVRTSALRLKVRTWRESSSGSKPIADCPGFGCTADYFARTDLSRPYDFFDCRVPGWFLIMMTSAYHATGDPYYLNAARVVVERVLEAQDKAPRPLPDYQAAGRKPFQQGGWSRMMVPGHCECEPRHRGNAGFMVAVLLSGLKYYHDVTRDERFRRVLTEALPRDARGSSYGKGFSMYYRVGPRVLADLEAAGLDLDTSQ
jgi:hypothetical protein